MASERLLILQPRNWALRRDHGMMLYYSRYVPQIVFSGEDQEAVVDIIQNLFIVSENIARRYRS